MDILLVIFGLALILGGANFLTDGSAALAKRFNIPEFIIGLTIVAIGTSTPEMVVSVLSAIEGSGDMAIGNVVGSNIFNIFVILGVCAIFKPIPLTMTNIKRDIPFGVISAFILGVVCYTGTIQRTFGVLMLLIYIAILYSTIKGTKKSEILDQEASGEQEESMPMWKMLLMIAGGLFGLIYGGDTMLGAAVRIAERNHIPQSVIAITLLAGGTSLPELASSVVSLIKGKSDMALGGVIGSCIANILLILGLSATITPLSMGGITMTDIAVVFLGSVLLLVAAYTFKKKYIDRFEGVLMLCGYAIYLWWLL